jgi:hypothetical protein
MLFAGLHVSAERQEWYRRKRSVRMAVPSDERFSCRRMLPGICAEHLAPRVSIQYIPGRNKKTPHLAAFFYLIWGETKSMLQIFA